MAENSRPQWHQNASFWAFATLGIGVVITVCAAMIHDMRGFLIFACPCFAVAAWEFAKSKRWKRPLIWGCLGFATSAALLLWLYIALSPNGRPAASYPPSISNETAQSQTQSGVQSKEDFDRQLATLYSALSKNHSPTGILRLFENDLSSNGFVERLSYEVKGSPDGDVGIGFNVYGDLVSNSFFLSIYVPEIPHAMDLCAALATGYKAYLNDAQSVHFNIPYPGDGSYLLSDNLKFSASIYLYYENFFSDDQISQLKTLYRSHGIRLIPRGPVYLNYRQEGGKPL